MSLLSLPKLEPLKRISPSRYHQIQQCALKEALQANRVPPILPVAPAAKLGMVAHKVLELASQGRVTDLDLAWEEGVRQVEDEMREAGEAFLLPLRDSAQRYEVKKRLTFAAAHRISESPGHQVSSSSAHSQTIGAEIWLESADGVLGGFVDRIIPSAQGVEIQDHKTGTVIEHETGDVKEAYEVQLLLYAGLYCETIGNWPEKLTISTLSGIKYDVPVDRARACRLMNDARATLQELNEHISSDYPAEELARPSSTACFFCGYRPACKPYWSARSHDHAWPADVKGPMQDVTRLGNGTLRAVIGDGAGTITVRGIPAERFSFLQKEPKTAMLCDLKRDTVEGVYRPSRTTTGYVLEE